MTHIPKTTEFAGANWDAYTEHEFKWLEIVTTKGILSRSELLTLLKSFDIQFGTPRWEDKLPISEFGNVLLSDIPKEQLIPAIERMISQSHPKCLTIDEFKYFLDSLASLPLTLLKKLFVSICKPELRSLAGEMPESQKQDLAFLILESFLQRMA